MLRGKNDWETAEMPTFSLAAIAGNSQLLPDGTLSRLIVVPLLPDNQGKMEPIALEVLDKPAAGLEFRIQQAMDQHQDSVRVSRPKLTSEG